MPHESALQVVLTVDDLPGDALGASARFHAAHVARVQQEATGGAGAVAIVVPPAPVDHTDWRRAAVHDLARALAPARVNMVSGRAGESLDATLAYLGNAPGVTGHYLRLNGD